MCLSSRSSSSRPLTFQLQVVVLLDIEIFKVFTHEMVRCSALFSISLTLQFPVAPKIFSQIRVQRRLQDLVGLQGFPPNTGFNGVLENLVEVFKAVSLDKVRRRLG